VPTLDLGRVVPTINGIEADENGNIVIDNVAHAETADSAANATTADMQRSLAIKTRHIIMPVHRIIHTMAAI